VRRLTAGVVLACLLAFPRGAATIQPQPVSDGIARLLQDLEHVVMSGDPSGYLGLLTEGADTSAARAFADSLILPGATRVVIRERDRYGLPASPAGSLYRMTAEVFSEFGSRGRLTTCQLRVRQRLAGGPFAIESQDVISSFGSLYRLALERRQYAATNLVLAKPSGQRPLLRG
jgi:hypothetical protein